MRNRSSYNIYLGAEGQEFPYDTENGAHDFTGPFVLGEDIDGTGNIVIAVILQANRTVRDWITTEPVSEQQVRVNDGESVFMLDEAKHCNHVMSVLSLKP